MAALTAQLGYFVSQLKLTDVPPDAQAIAKMGMTDCLGVLIAGARDPVVPMLDRELSSRDSPVNASLIPSGERRNVEDAALVNGAAAHVLDYDDVTLDGHPSAVLLSAIFAQAEAVGASGAEMLTAYAAGYEVWAELLVREPVPLHNKGWHPTAVRGTVGAAAACARLRRMSPEQCRDAMAIAASMASGVVANFGSLTKCFHVGRAAQSGVLAARLAGAGLTASPDVLEHRSGYLMAFSPTGKPDLDRAFDAGRKEWHLARQGLNLKRYPICYATHRVIDGTLDLVQQHDLKPSDIERIHVLTGEGQMVMLRNARPKTAFEAKFSMQFAVASAIVARAVGLAQLDDAFVQRPEVQSLFPRLTIETTTETMDGSAFAPAEHVEITTTRGKVLKGAPVSHAKGSMQRPLSRAELQEKFDDCVGDTWSAAQRSAVFDRMMSMEHAPSVAGLISPQ